MEYRGVPTHDIRNRYESSWHSLLGGKMLHQNQNRKNMIVFIVTFIVLRCATGLSENSAPPTVDGSILNVVISMAI